MKCLGVPGNWTEENIRRREYRESEMVIRKLCLLICRGENNSLRVYGSEFENFKWN